MRYILVSIKPASDDKYKYTVKLAEKNDESKTHTVHFGAKGYSDYTKHKDLERKKRYIIRHKKREDWTSTGILTAGFWSRWVLWNKTSFRASVDNVKEKFHL